MLYQGAECLWNYLELSLYLERRGKEEERKERDGARGANHFGYTEVQRPVSRGQQESGQLPVSRRGIKAPQVCDEIPQKGGTTTLYLTGE